MRLTPTISSSLCITFTVWNIYAIQLFNIFWRQKHPSAWECRCILFAWECAGGDVVCRSVWIYSCFRVTEVSGSLSYKLIRRIKVLMELLLFPQLFSLLSSFVHLLSLISEVPIGNGLLLDLGANPKWY